MEIFSFYVFNKRNVIAVNEDRANHNYFMCGKNTHTHTHTLILKFI